MMATELEQVFLELELVDSEQQMLGQRWSVRAVRMNE